MLDLVGYYGKIKVKDDWTLLVLSKWMNGDVVTSESCLSGPFRRPQIFFV